MTCDPNDPRLTAFVLGELDPGEHSDFETMLAESADCRQAVEEIRLTVGLLTTHLRDESASHAPVAEENHQPLAAVVPPSDVVAAPWWRKNRFRFPAIAATLLLAGPILILALKTKAERGATVRLALAPPTTRTLENASDGSPRVVMVAKARSSRFAGGEERGTTAGRTLSESLAEAPRDQYNEQASAASGDDQLGRRQAAGSAAAEGYDRSLASDAKQQPIQAYQLARSESTAAPRPHWRVGLPCKLGRARARPLPPAAGGEDLMSTTRSPATALECLWRRKADKPPGCSPTRLPRVASLKRRSRRRRAIDKIKPAAGEYGLE